jgi:hypothetical protein
MKPLQLKLDEASSDTIQICFNDSTPNSKQVQIQLNKLELNRS